MKVSILSAFPDLYTPFLSTSLIGRCQKSGLIDIEVETLFSFVKPKERIDASTFGHGTGMLIRPEVVEKAIEAREAEHGKALKVFFSPHGRKLEQRVVERLSNSAREKGHLLLFAARYEGVDARAEQEYADEIISLGDFVLMGGDLPVMVFLESILRFIPGIVSKSESVKSDSFSGSLVDYPEYCAPVVWKGHVVPEEIRSGNHALMKSWRKKRAVERTAYHHFDWFSKSRSTEEEKHLMLSCLPSHYVVLMHSNVQVKSQELEGTTSVTSIDIHDIARSAKTYGIKNFFIVTPLLDQQKIVTTLLNFWQTGKGVDYNRSRHEAVQIVKLKSSLPEVVASIYDEEQKEPILIATSARAGSGNQVIHYGDQSLVWGNKKPVLIILGTGQGLSSELVDQCDYLLIPLEGLSTFNHLSVRSAAAIIFDRWLGLNIRW